MLPVVEVHVALPRPADGTPHAPALAVWHWLFLDPRQHEIGILPVPPPVVLLRAQGSFDLRESAPIWSRLGKSSCCENDEHDSWTVAELERMAGSILVDRTEASSVELA